LLTGGHTRNVELKSGPAARYSRLAFKSA